VGWQERCFYKVGKKLNERSLGDINRRYKREYFPKLIEDPNVPPEDKQKIRELLKKPWNPYREISNTDLCVCQ
jgi:hypothetical protein